MLVLGVAIVIASWLGPAARIQIFSVVGKLAVKERIGLASIGVVLVVIGLIGWFRTDGTSTEEPPAAAPVRTVTATPTVTVTVDAAESSRLGPKQTQSAMPPVPEVGVVYDSGLAGLNSYEGGSHGPSEYAYLADALISAFPYGLAMEEGSVLAPYPKERPPQIGDCAAIPATNWVVEALTADLEPGAIFCIVSGDGRYGYVTIREAELTTGGELESVSFSYLIWNGFDD